MFDVSIAGLCSVIACSVFAQSPTLIVTTSHVAGIFVSVYLAACSVYHLNVPENTPIRQVAHVRPLLHRTLVMLDLMHVDEVFYCYQETDSRSLGNSWHNDLSWLAALTAWVQG